MILQISTKERIQFVKIHVEGILDRAGYLFNRTGFVYEAVPKDEKVVAAAHLLDTKHVKDVMHYLHRSMDGDHSGKKRMLADFANNLEAERVAEKS